MQEQWEAASANIRSDPLRTALQWWLAGDSWRRAAERVGITHQTLRDAARRHGLIANVYRGEAVASLQRQLAMDSGRQLLERLHGDDPDAISTKDMAVVMGISTDKVFKYEQLAGERPEGCTPAELLDRLAAQIDAGQELTLTLSKTQRDPVDPLPDAVDVTPTKQG